ncbi:MAG: hypothetical protein ACLP50_21790 [Solirubrobacteraceae bacterium]
MATLPESARRVLEGPGLAHLVTLEPDGRPQTDEYVVVHGRARITEGGAPALLARLAQVYLGAGVKFPPMDDPPPGYITHIAVQRTGGVGPWAG